MARLLVSGLVNVETTLKIDGFPLEYFPVRYAFDGIRSTVSGVGYNVARALRVLGQDVRLLSMIGDDAAGRVIGDALQRDGLAADGIRPVLGATPQSVVIVVPSGMRQIHVDLKSVQETAYPSEQVERALDGCELACLCNINFSRPLLQRAKQRGIRVATDVHAIADINSEYDRDFMAAADILFQSHETLPCSPEAWIRRLWQVYGTDIAVIGLGASGAMLGLRDGHRIEARPALVTRAVVNTVGAGDALFSSFVDGLARGRDPIAALERALVFASWKIGESGGAAGFLSADALDQLAAAIGCSEAR